jgi:penicillin amidase
VKLLAADPDPRLGQALALLKTWDNQVTASSVPAAIFNVFFTRWCRTVADERLQPALAAFAAVNAAGLAAALLAADDARWFGRQDRVQAARRTLLDTLAELTQRCGPDLTGWTWGRIHSLLQKHFLSGRGDLGALLDRSGLPVAGDGTTVCNCSYDPQYAAALGPSYRMVADLADPHAGLSAVEVGSTCGHPGSPHYDDQIAGWNEGAFHYFPLTGDEPPGEAVLTLTST